MNFCLFTVKPLNSTSKKYFNRYTKEVLFKTKWDSSWLSPSFAFEGDLVTAYPQLKEVVVKELDADDPSAGKADFFWSEILLKRVGQSEDDVMSTLIHEIQHFLQSFDGRDCGASVGEYLKKTKDTSLAEALYYFNVGEMEAREAEGQPTQYVDSQFVNTAKTVDMVVEKLTGVRPKGAFLSFFEKFMGKKSECRGATMQLYTRRPLSANSELTVSPLTGEDIYVTPWTDDWLTSEFKLTGDLLKYFGAKVPKIRPMTSQEEADDPSTAGWYSPFFCTIVFKNSTEGLSTIVHELQHALQTLDGRSGGGNSDSFKKGAKVITQASNPLSKITVIPKEFWPSPVLELETSYRKFSAWRHSQFAHRHPDWLASKMYRHIIGEIEARMAEGAVGPLDESFIHYDLNACQVAAQAAGINPYHMELIMGNGNDILDRDIQEVIAKYKISCEEKRAEDKARLARIKAEQALALVGTKEEQLEEYFWSRLGDEYRLPKSKKRTNYKKRAI